MTATIQSKIHALPDSHIAAVAEQFFQKVFAILPSEEIDLTMEGILPLDAIRAQGDAALDKTLPQAASVEIGRALLLGCASEATLAPLLAEACDAAANQLRGKMVIGTVLAVGVVVNLTYLIMTCEVNVKRGTDGKVTWSVTKRASPPEFVANILTKLSSQFGGAR